MPGVIKQHKRRNFGRPFPASRYNDPRGGRASALERNVLRYRAVETVLCLFFAEEIREFMIKNVLPGATLGENSAWVSDKAKRISRLFSNLLSDA